MCYYHTHTHTHTHTTYRYSYRLYTQYSTQDYGISYKHTHTHFTRTHTHFTRTHISHTHTLHTQKSHTYTRTHIDTHTMGPGAGEFLLSERHPMGTALPQELSEEQFACFHLTLSLLNHTQHIDTHTHIHTHTHTHTHTSLIKL